ncbi:hypothetical protein P689_119193 [Candidatus Riesia pediculischaeffi PTSU]|uniref:Uncharacterized protein n=1 Tax=Candidatus Riesia pediculischaeffi PTSU TaxID=1401651 RepID=A0A0C1S0Y4_9ENTR|nr:hypothetical protein P689_119193 [Candidatus Riesia pediculischaeffi PTSU]
MNYDFFIIYLSKYYIQKKRNISDIFQVSITTEKRTLIYSTIVREYFF